MDAFSRQYVFLGEEPAITGIVEESRIISNIHTLNAFDSQIGLLPKFESEVRVALLAVRLN